ncbi:MAG: hypothetical protein IJP29_01935 [Lachnospiraceae bacterium]|nr:hypothetical protein [Lachnospiraceae bacterium]
MAKRNHLLAITVMLVALLCSVLQSGLSFDAMMTVPISAEGTVVEAQECVVVYEVSRGYSNVTRQDYLTSSPITRIATTFKRSQNNYRHYPGQGVLTAILEEVSKIVLFSFIMILFATGKAGLSMSFQCLLYYIQNTDGKKRIA